MLGKISIKMLILEREHQDLFQNADSTQVFTINIREYSDCTLIKVGKYHCPIFCAKQVIDLHSKE